MKKRILKVIFFLIMGILLFVSYYYLNKYIGFGIPCLFHKITGLYCPGCGFTRMLFALFNFKITKAFRYNQLVFILLPFLALYFGYHIYLYIVNKKDKILVRIPKIYGILLLIIVLLWGVIRNLKWFYFLRP